MNIQSLMKQAQSLQKDMLKTKEEIDNKNFTFENELVMVTVNGKKEVLELKYKIDSNFDIESDKEILEDMTTLAINSAMKQVDKETETKMGKFSNSMPGLF